MGCSVTEKLQPSLDKFYDGIFMEYYNVGIKDPDVSYLANQGVLMLNASLTCEMNKPGSHCNIWEPFIAYLFENVLDVVHAPVVFLGKEAVKYNKYVAPFTWTFELSHPASAAYSHTMWDTEKVFTKIDKILMDNNGDKIEWFKTE